jgi:hypothetical protein
MMTTSYNFNARAPRPPLVQLAAPAGMPGRQPLGYPAASDYAHGLANSLDTIQRNPPRTMPALGDDLLAEALLRYAQRNTAEGQTPPSAAVGAGGDGSGTAQAAVGAAPSNGQVAYAPAPAVGASAAPPSAAGPIPSKPQDSSALAAMMQRLQARMGPGGGGVNAYGAPGIYPGPQLR